MFPIVVEIPMHIYPFSNTSYHWTINHKNKKAQKELVKLNLCVHEDEFMKAKFLYVRLTRLSPRELDFDNLILAFKAIIDAICEIKHPNLAPGRADGKKDFKFEFEQDKGKPEKIRIEISDKKL